MDGGRQQGDCPRRHKYIYFEFLIPSFTSSKPNSSFLSLKLSFPQIMILFCQLSKQQNNVVILVIVLRSFPLFSQMLIFDSVYIYISPPFLVLFSVVLQQGLCPCQDAAALQCTDAQHTVRPLSCCCSLGFAECKPDYVAFLDKYSKSCLYVLGKRRKLSGLS